MIEDQLNRRFRGMLKGTRDQENVRKVSSTRADRRPSEVV
jgi:hypothetical protein